MNQLFHHVTWNQYLTAALIASIIYYLFVFLRCYRPELQKLKERLNSHGAHDDPFQDLNYPEEGETADIVTSCSDKSSDQPHEAGTPQANDHHNQEPAPSDILGERLKAIIGRAAGKPYAPAVLIPQLKQLLQEPHTFSDAEKAAISHLIVAQCEDTGTGLLTKEEVDQWWER
ncbi:hypothetical protein LX99_04252 [Mucilaginibacter oryzae]|uniref:Uncharacterized protein n=1 Tax=Mucilaginibacter oryzae TaxID=468058 RepID=A0A316H0T8_9SPHI|nr:hypothetical protein [Mucilaginibacter oryzae]PWK72922.1 hypothetical protein LX99_04252 [Mucilaginibacter oryzae]